VYSPFWSPLFKELKLPLPKFYVLKKNWWKFLSVALLLYSIIVALSAKVGPGIGPVQPDYIKTGILDSVHITGYNTSFTKSTNTIRIKKGKFLVEAFRTRVISEKELVAYFEVSGDINDSMYLQNCMVLIESETDGLYGSPNSIRFKKTEHRTVFDRHPTEVQFKRKTFFAFPSRYQLHETIRNLNFHVPMWFAMITLMILSFIQSLKQLRTNDIQHDHKANSYASVGVLFGIAGIITGAFWARFTWGPFWPNDPKLNGAAIGVMIYSAYLILRSSIDEETSKAKISAVYNVFAFPIFIVLVLIYPKLAGYSLHPGSGDSVGFDSYDLDNDLRKVFYPAVLGWILLSLWIAQLKSRIEKIKWKRED
jgi:heme exporter protein C